MNSDKLVKEGAIIISIFTERLKQVRIENNVTQAALGKAVNKSRTAITSYELGNRLPDIGTMAAIADFFDEDINWLLGRTDIRTAHALDDFVITSEAKKLNDAYSRLTVDDKELVKGLICSLAEKSVKL